MQAPTKVVGQRVVAFLIDFLILAAVTVAAWYATTKSVPQPCFNGVKIGDHCRGWTAGDGAKRAIFFVVVLIAWLALFVIVPGLKGTSPGKSALGIRIVDERGNPPGIGRALARALLFWLLEGAVIGLIVAAVSQRNQRIGDMVAKTLVVRKDAVGAIAGGAGQPAFAGAIGAPFGPPPTGQPAAQPQQQQPPPQPAYKADWYPDPQGQARLRYWDGQRWTEHTSA